MELASIQLEVLTADATKDSKEPEIHVSISTNVHQTQIFVKLGASVSTPRAALNACVTRLDSDLETKDDRVLVRITFAPLWSHYSMI